MGEFLFGLYQHEFKSFAYSFLTIFELLWGGYKLEYILYYNKIVIYLFGLSLTFISVILLNFIMAIISSHYFEYYANQGDLNANFIKLFLKNFINKEESKKHKAKQWLIKRIYNSAVRLIRNWVLYLPPPLPPKLIWSIKSKECSRLYLPRGEGGGTSDQNPPVPPPLPPGGLGGEVQTWTKESTFKETARCKKLNFISIRLLDYSFILLLVVKVYLYWFRSKDRQKVLLEWNQTQSQQESKKLNRGLNR